MVVEIAFESIVLCVSILSQASSLVWYLLVVGHYVNCSLNLEAKKA